MTDIQQAITRLRAADEQHPDFWNTLQDRDADPQMIRDVVSVARAYCRRFSPAHQTIERIRLAAKLWGLDEAATAESTLDEIVKSAEVEMKR